MFSLNETIDILLHLIYICMYMALIYYSKQCSLDGHVLRKEDVHVLKMAFNFVFEGYGK